MGDTILIEPGAQPWAPGYDSELIEELARFDVPTIGLLQQAGNRYAFWCVEGWNDPKSLWAYILLDEEDVTALRGVEGASEGYEILSRLAVANPVTVALADEKEGVVLVASLDQVEVSRPTSVDAVARRIVEDAYWALDKHIDHLRHQVQSRRTHRGDTTPAAV